MKEILSNHAAFIESDIIAFRRDLHAHPELSGMEHRTSARVQEELHKLGIEFRAGIAGTGVVAWIDGKPGGPCIGLRADMDALPIHELNDIDYRSSHPGIMHACGHDVHSACLLGAATLLKRTAEHWSGRVLLIFQPSEEKFPSGAKAMIDEGILDEFMPACIIAQHVTPELEFGKIGFRKGMFMASADEIYLTIKGKGGHASQPQNVIDPILTSAHILVALQQLVSRKANPNTPSVLSFGDIQGNGATNIIPDEVRLKGTLRTFDEKWRAEAHDWIRKTSTGIASSMGAQCEVYIPEGNPFVYNHERLTDILMEVSADSLGSDKTVEMPLRMGSEDFAYFSHKIPSSFYRLGTGNPERGITHGIHTPHFNVDERAIRLGMEFMANAAIELLNRNFFG